MSNQNNTVAAATFYDLVAKEYDHKMNMAESNEEVRKKVATYLLSVANGKNVLDFGGGTGADLKWLTNNEFTVCFCEPSEGMRNKAIELNRLELRSNSIDFLTTANTDFHTWESSSFKHKFDIVLANFAVLNSIEDLDVLFEKLSAIINSKGSIVATLLDTTYEGIRKSYLRNFISAFAKRKKPIFLTDYLGTKHVSFLHTPNKIKQASSAFFSCEKIEQLGGFGFMLVHLKKRN